MSDNHDIQLEPLSKPGDSGEFYENGAPKNPVYQRIDVYPTPIEAVWVESPLPDFMLFLDSPDGQIIKEKKGAYYPPVEQVVYDRKGNPFISFHPAPKTAEQKLAQANEKANLSVVKPIEQGFKDFANRVKENVDKSIKK